MGFSAQFLAKKGPRNLTPNKNLLKLSGHHSLFSVHMLFPQVFNAFIHGFFSQRERQIHTITLMFTIHYPNSRANGSLIAPITFTYSLQSRESWPLSSEINTGLLETHSGVCVSTGCPQLPFNFRRQAIHNSRVSKFDTFKSASTPLFLGLDKEKTRHKIKIAESFENPLDGRSVSRQQWEEKKTHKHKHFALVRVRLTLRQPPG